MADRPTIVLLGPQRFQPSLRATLDSLGIDGRLAVVTAGWQEREAEVDELREHVGRETTNLELYRRFDEVEQGDPALMAAVRERQDQLQQLQRYYRMRLHHALVPARELLAQPGRGGILAESRRAAIRTLRTLDRQHLVRVRKIHREFQEQWQPGRRPHVSHHRQELADVLDGCVALAVAGGNVAILLGRLRMFDLLPLLGDRPVVAWSAGAMAFCDRVVLFHDSPPQGAGDPELFDAGLGLYRGIVPLPHASIRLRLADPTRVALFARRFAPAVCVALDPGARVDFAGGRWQAADGTRCLGRAGNVPRFVAS